MSIIIEDCGLLNILISYPFKVNGCKFFHEEFENKIFKIYKEESADSFGGCQKKNYINSQMYKPFGYHLFGNYNLAVLSLVDGYAFGNRVFHPGHGYHRDPQEDNTQKTDYNYQLLTGTSYHEEGEKEYLLTKARKTFLRKKERYPFIGITRFKLNNSLLIGSGIELLQALRNKIEAYLKNKRHLDAFVLDSFGNTEITLFAFSNNLKRIHELLYKVRQLTLQDLRPFPGDNKSLLAERESQSYSQAHIISTSYTNLGYDILWQPQPDKIKASYTFLPVENPKEIQAQIKWEIKPGHENQLGEVWNKVLPLLASKTQMKSLHYLLGGNAQYTKFAPFDLETFRKFIEKIGSDETVPHHIKNLRLQLFFEETLKPSSSIPVHPNYERAPNLGFETEEMNHFRKMLCKCGASKLTKERFLKMLARFNDCIRDKHFYIYFIELKDFLNGVATALKRFSEDEDNHYSIEMIDNYMNNVITAFECAFYNRFHQSTRMGLLADINLEYNGGIQQYVTSFDLAYKESIEILSYTDDEQYEKAFVYISGYENVVSKREILRINMNLLTYPELFAVSIFKETVNFMLERYENIYTPLRKEELEKEKRKQTKEQNDIRKLLLNWEKILSEKKIPAPLEGIFKDSALFNPHLKSHQILKDFPHYEWIEYFVADVHNLYFGFNGDFELLYYYYWKYFLQLSQCYNREGELCLQHFMTFLIRLFFVRFYLLYERDYKDSETKTNKEELQAWGEKAKHEIKEKYQYSPFAAHLSHLWQIHFEDTLDAALFVWQKLQDYNFYLFLKNSIRIKINRKVSPEYAIYAYTNEHLQDSMNYEDWCNIQRSNRESLRKIQDDLHTENTASGIKDSQQNILPFCTEMRNYHISAMVRLFKEKKLIQPDDRLLFSDPYFISDMLIAYLQVIKALDMGITPDSHPIPYLIRDEEGKPCYKNGLNPHFTSLLSDPHGGIFTHGWSKRRVYFAYRTILYKSLWDYAIKLKKEKIKKEIEKKRKQRMEKQPEN